MVDAVYLVIKIRFRIANISSKSFMTTNGEKDLRITLCIVTAAALLAGTFWYHDPFLEKATPNYVVVERGQTLTFRNGENRAALNWGWSEPESWGVWSDWYEAQLSFVVLGISGENASIFIECMPLLHAEVPEQKIEFWSRNIRLGEVTLKEPKASFSIPLNGLKLGEDLPLVLRLRMPFARSPQELHLGDDPRKLAVGLVSVRFDN